MAQPDIRILLKKINDRWHYKIMWRTEWTKITWCIKLDNKSCTILIYKHMPNNLFKLSYKHSTNVLFKNKNKMCKWNLLPFHFQTIIKLWRNYLQICRHVQMSLQVISKHQLSLNTTFQTCLMSKNKLTALKEQKFMFLWPVQFTLINQCEL